MQARARGRAAYALPALLLTVANVLPWCLRAETATLETCNKVATCLIDGATVCDVALQKCPPCIFPNADKYNCFAYDASAATTQCPFVSLTTNTTNYVDCSSAANWAKWSNSSSSGSNTTSSAEAGATNSSSTPTPSTSAASTTAVASSDSSSDAIMFIGIGVGVLVVLIVIVAICMRRKRQAAQQRNRRGTSTNHHAKRDRAKTRTKHEEAFGGGYNNVLDTSKNGYGSYNQHEALSVDGMLGDAPQTPVILGAPSSSNNGPPPPMMNNTGKSIGTKNAFTSVNELVDQDISIRCTTSANVFDEYLKMKQEMNYDHDDDAMSEVMSEMSDYESDTMSMHKFSLESSQGIVRHDGGLSITDSEYDEHLRNRGESECYSEMSYNDEKYSFSEDDDMASEFGRSKVGNELSRSKGPAPDREVEI